MNTFREELYRDATLQRLFLLCSSLLCLFTWLFIGVEGVLVLLFPLLSPLPWLMGAALISILRRRRQGITERRQAKSLANAVMQQLRGDS